MARKSQPVKKPTAKQTAAQKRQTQNRREIWALVCIFLAIFSIICCFNTTAFLIRPFASLIAGLFGQSGRYILPLALIATVVILFTSRGKPVRLRIVSVFTLILTVSAVYHLIQGEALVWEWKVVPALFKGGISGTTGGLLGGLLAMLLKTGITVVGAYIVLILVMLVQIITIMNMTVNSIITAIKNRPRPTRSPSPSRIRPNASSTMWPTAISPAWKSAVRRNLTCPWTIPRWKRRKSGRKSPAFPRRMNIWKSSRRSARLRDRSL